MVLLVPNIGISGSISDKVAILASKLKEYREKGLSDLRHWAVIFRDDPAMLEIRKSNRDGHLAFVAEHGDRIKMAGGFRHQPETPLTGGMWIVEADSSEDVEALIRKDPYYHPVHRKYDIQLWGLIRNSFITDGVRA